MEKDLEIDISVIILTECYGIREDYARKLLTRGADYPSRPSRHRTADREALDAAVGVAISRLEARCSKIEG